MNKAAKELIQKLAMPKNVVANLRSLAKPPGADPGNNPMGAIYTRNRLAAHDAGKNGKPPDRAIEVAKMRKTLATEATKQSSMKTFIDDFIKGAQNNTFGRPVSVQQGFDPSPLDLAKFAGALTALNESGYSVKQAAEYLGLTEKQVQHIIATVR